ncbi:MAG: conjugative transfer signal peptidase TraF [Burkholderiaceae bacterium]
MLAWLGAGARTVIADARRHRLAFAIFGAIWALALTRVFIHHTPILPVLFNWTASLPYRIVVVDHGPMPLARGDLIVYAFDGEAAERDYPGLKRQPFFKRIVGVAGDVVTVDGRDVFINGLHVGRAKTHTFDRRPLDPIAPTVIPPGHVYVQGTSADSFDSRYRSSGLVSTTDVVARVRPLL